MDFDRASDEELVEAARGAPAPVAERCLEKLYRRFHPRVAVWCLRFCGDRTEAADLAQEVFLRAHSRLDSFRFESRFSTWLYTVARSVAINRGLRRQRRQESVRAWDADEEPVESAPGPTADLEQRQIAERVRRAMSTELDPLEARVLYLHHVDGMTLPAITELLELTNRSGAKAYVVSGMRKLRRLFPDREFVERGKGRG